MSTNNHITDNIKFVNTAIDYALANLPVFPLKTGGKTPITAHGHQDATIDIDTIIAWWEKTPDANIGIRCNNLLVIDADGEKGRNSLIEIETTYEKLPLTWTVQTGRGGIHVIFRVPESLNIRPGAGKYGYENIDIRANDSYIVAAGSITENEYKTIHGSYEEIADAPDWLIELVSQNQQADHKPEPVPDRIPEGMRNDALARLAGSMRNKGISQAGIEAALLAENQEKCTPPLPEDEVKKIAESISRYPDGNNVYIYTLRTGQDRDKAKRDKNGTENGTITSDTVLEWVKNTSGWFETQELDRELGITSQKDKENRRKIMLRLKERGIIQPHQRINKQFRYVDTAITQIDFKTANSAAELRLKWPLQIETMINLYPGNTAVIAGSPNAGKTAFLIDFLYLNNDSGIPTYYICSEMEGSELRSRLELVEGMDINEWNFEAISRSSDFADVVVPDAVNIIDYLEITTDLYAINTHLTDIQNKLSSGIAIVALQKKIGADMGRGQEFGLEKPKLYLSLDKNKAKIIKGKSWAVKNYDPNGLKCSFKVQGGCRIIQSTEWQHPDDNY